MSTISVVEGEDLSVYLDAEEETPKSDAIKPKKPGGDLLVYLEGVDETPKSAVMDSKKTIAQLQEEFGRATTIFLSNKNLHHLPRHLRGGIIWLPSRGIIAVLHIASSNDIALRIILLDIYVSVLPKRLPFIGQASTNSSAHYFRQPHSPLIRSQTYLLCLFCCDPFKNTTKVYEVIYLASQFRSCKGLMALLLWIETDIFNPDQNYLKYLV
jgi:hypothetical protein